MAARVAGATTIIAVDTHADRLDLARELGATHAFDGDGNGDENVPDRVQKITHGGADFAFDTTGTPAVIAADLESLAIGGTMGLVGVERGTVPVGPLLMERMLVMKGIVEGDAVPQRFIPQLIELWQQGRFPFDRLIQTFPLSLVDEAERAFRRGRVVKPVLIPGE
jgi:aryl-alcohol dehydrogenase